MPDNLNAAYVIALDQGTTSSRAVIFDGRGNAVAMSQQEYPQHYPFPGWVEHDPYDILGSTLAAMSRAFRQSGLSAADIAAIGVANQRETVVVWDKGTGKPVCNAIVWQCRRTAPDCRELIAGGLEKTVRDRTGLPVDAYFSGTKIKWILDNVSGARAAAQRGELLCGTVDSWLIYNLTGGAVHMTDCTNAARTMLFDINRLCWDEDICGTLDIPMSMLPEVCDCAGRFGEIAPGIKGIEELAGVPVCGSAGDQQAALFGQACFSVGECKNTYGTGCFTLMNVGEKPVASKSRLISTVAWRMGKSTVYALEGSVFNAGSAIRWLRDEMGMLSCSHDIDILAESAADSGGVCFVPAFTGLGAPYWDMDARGSFFGLTRGTDRPQIARAVLEGIAFSVCDLVRAMESDCGSGIRVLRADGGASVSDVMLKFQADMLGIEVARPRASESTALGAAYFALIGAGIFASPEDIRAARADGSGAADDIFLPTEDGEWRAARYERWQKAVAACRAFN